MIRKYYSLPSRRKDKIMHQQFNFWPSELTEINYFLILCGSRCHNMLYREEKERLKDEEESLKEKSAEYADAG